MADAIALLFPNVATTGDINVRVAANFLPDQSAPASGRWFWSYHVRIENGGEGTVQLLTRHWHVIDGRGIEHEVQGEGVVGEMPVIAPGASFDYVSGCPLSTATGAMHGSFQMVDQHGGLFEIAIPRFELTSPA